MTDHPDVELTARYPLADTTTAADLAELLLTVPADARIGFTVPIRAVQSYADTAPPQQPRTMTATWTVPAGQPLTPPNTADDVAAAGWAVPMVGVDIAASGEPSVLAAITDELVQLRTVVVDDAPAWIGSARLLASCGVTRDLVELLAKMSATGRAERADHLLLDEYLARLHTAAPEATGALEATGYDLTGPEANFAGHEARRRAAAAQVPAVGSTMRSRLADPLAMGGTGL